MAKKKYLVTMEKKIPKPKKSSPKKKKPKPPLQDIKVIEPDDFTLRVESNSYVIARHAGITSNCSSLDKKEFYYGELQHTGAGTDEVIQMWGNYNRGYIQRFPSLEDAMFFVNTRSTIQELLKNPTSSRGKPFITRLMVKR